MAKKMMRKLWHFFFEHGSFVDRKLDEVRSWL